MADDYDEENFASRKKGRIATNVSQTNELTVRHKHPDETEAIHWKDKFETIKRESKEKITKLTNDLQKSVDRQDKLERYAFMLEERLGKNEESKSTSGSSLKSPEKLLEESKVLQFYKTATSMEVKWSPANPTDYVCTITNKKISRGTKVIFKFPDSNTLEYIPKANADMLPEQFRMHLSTEPDAVSVILGEILTNLYNDDDGEEEG